MASKKQLEKRIEDLEARLTVLENMHATISRAPAASYESTIGNYFGFIWENKVGHYGCRNLTKQELRDRMDHPVEEPTTSTKEIFNLTLRELARFVIDGTPIKRESSAPAKYTAVYAPANKTETISTRLGNITIQNDRK